jgi:hypothetical protein
MQVRADRKLLLVQAYDAASKINDGELSHPGRKAMILGAGLALQYAEMVRIQQVSHGGGSGAESSLRTARQHSRNC